MVRTPFTHVYATIVSTNCAWFIQKQVNKLPYKKLQYPTSVKNIDLDVHIKVFKKANQTNGEIMEVDIINLFGFILRNNIFEWGWKFCSNSSEIHVWKIGEVFWQTVPNHEKWQGSLYAIMKHSMVNYWMCGALLWTPIQVNELLTS